MRLFKTPLYQPIGGRVDVPDVAIGDQGSQDKLDLRPLVRIVPQLRVVQQWVKHAQVCVPELHLSARSS